MRVKHVIIAALAFLLILIAAYFGASIHNSKTNDPIEYLNVLDNIHYYDADLIPTLNYRAALITIPITLIILVLEVIILFKTQLRIVKNIAIGLTLAVLIISTISWLTIFNPSKYDFSIWGYIWIAMGAIILVGNLLSIFIRPTTKKV